MQKIGCYLFERRDGMDSETARRAEVQRIEQEISKWLQSKGGSDRSPAQYLPEDGSTGTVSRERANDDQRSWSLVRLDELTSGGRRFVASISVTSTTKRSGAGLAWSRAGGRARWTRCRSAGSPVDFARELHGSRWPPSKGRLFPGANPSRDKNRLSKIDNPRSTLL